MKIKFTVPGNPVGKGRPRFSRQGQYVRTYTPEKTVNYETLVKLEYERQCGTFRFSEDTPIDMRITAYLPIPKSVSQKKRRLMADKKIRPMKKPDVDNCGKAVADALLNLAYKDDCQIVDMSIRKFYSEEPRTVITIQSSGVKSSSQNNEKSE